jgi:hypothetical protein
MAGYVELTTEDGARALFNVEQLVMFAPVSVEDPARGTRLTFGFSTGVERKNWRVRVLEEYARVKEAVSEAAEAAE